MFPGREAAIWAAATNWRRLPARIEILALPLASSQWDRRLRGRWTSAPISHFLPKLYTVRAGTRKSPGLIGAEVSRGIPFLGPHPGVVAISRFMALLSFIDPRSLGPVNCSFGFGGSHRLANRISRLEIDLRQAMPRGILNDWQWTLT